MMSHFPLSLDQMGELKSGLFFEDFEKFMADFAVTFRRKSQYYFGHLLRILHRRPTIFFAHQIARLELFILFTHIGPDAFGTITLRLADIRTKG